MKTMTKVTVTLPIELVEKVRKSVDAGKARSVSSWMADVVQKNVEAQEYRDVLDEIIYQGGPPTPEESAAAEAILAKLV